MKIFVEVTKIIASFTIDIFISSDRVVTDTHSLRGEEDTLAEVHAIIGGLDVVAEEESVDLGEEDHEGEAHWAPDAVEEELDQVADRVGLNWVHI